MQGHCLFGVHWLRLQELLLALQQQQQQQQQMLNDAKRSSKQHSYLTMHKE
jgi:hypothetical protein